MTIHELTEKMKSDASKLNELHRKLLEPARAAANQMKDAGMHRGADPLLAVIFKIDAVNEGMRQTLIEYPAMSLEALFSILPKGGSECGPS